MDSCVTSLDVSLKKKNKNFGKRNLTVLSKKKKKKLGQNYRGKEKKGRKGKTDVGGDRIDLKTPAPVKIGKTLRESGNSLIFNRTEGSARSKPPERDFSNFFEFHF